MSNEILHTPVPGADPCGADLRWEQAFMEASQALDQAISDSNQDATIEGEQLESDSITFDDVIDMVERLSEQTKDIRLLVTYAEAMWRGHGLTAFAEAMEDLVAVMTTWPDPDTGVHPRGDPDDGDLSERAAPIGRLMSRVPELAATVGWGPAPVGVAERQAASATLGAVFENWGERLEAICGPSLVSPREGRQALAPLLGVEGPDLDPDAVGEQAESGAQMSPSADAWEMIERSAELMVRQDHHSPAIPVLHMLMLWRTLGITEVADVMRQSGVTLEQLLESIKRQTEGGQ